MAHERQERPAGMSPTTPITSTAPVRYAHRSGVGGTTKIADCALQRVRRVGGIQPAGGQRHRARARVEPQRRALTVRCHVLVSPSSPAMRLQPQTSRAPKFGAHPSCSPVLTVATKGVTITSQSSQAAMRSHGPNTLRVIRCCARRRPDHLAAERSERRHILVVWEASDG
jgi:hypothetical protein